MHGLMRGKRAKPSNLLSLTNRYGHPDAEAVARIEAAGSHILYTMKSGQIKVRACEDGLVAEEFVTIYE